MKVTDDYFSKFLGQPQQLKIPIYQRKYSWERKQCEQLFKDIERIGQSDKKSHFIGSLVFQSYRGRISTLVIIDGQQRITTLSLIMAALARYLVENPEAQNIIDYDAEYIVNEYLFNVNRKGEMRYKLLLTDDDDKIYKKIIDNILPKDEFKFNDNDKSSKLFKSYELFRKTINEENVEAIWRGIDKLYIVSLDLGEDGEDSPQAIFESLNSTGKELNSTDLIRNFLLMDLSPEEQESIYYNYWRPIEKVFENNKESFDEFIKHYLIIQYNNIIYGDIYDAFKKFRKQERFKTIEDLVKDVYKYWEFFKKIIFNEEKNSKLKQSFKSINQLPYNIIRPFIIRLYEDYEKGNLKLEEFIEIINYTESYMVRRAICDRDSQSLNAVFAKMYKRLDPDNYLESYKYVLSSRIGKTSIPDDDEFEKYFVNVDLYHSKGINRYVLLKLTNFNSKELTDIGECNIEHIMPQNPNLSEEWKEELGPDWEEIHTNYLHVVGNLTLTGSNSELGDKPFMEKRKMHGGFDESTINLNSYFKNVSHWNKDEIIKRSNILFEYAKEIWKYPYLSDETKAKYDDKHKQSTLDDEFKQDNSENPNIRYWTQFIKQMEENYPIFNTQRKPSTRNEFILPTGKNKAKIHLSINSITNEVRTQLVISDKKLYEYLYNQKNEIESEFNIEFTWENLEDKKSASIFIINDKFDLEDDWEWDNSIKWQLDTAEIMYAAFKDKINEFY